MTVKQTWTWRRTADDFIGLRIGRLVIIGRGGTVTKARGEILELAICKCDCGKEKSIRLNNLFKSRQRTESCGCKTSETLRKKNVVEYNIWRGMKDRCYNPKATNHHNYGGRGIIVCEKWKNSFQNFLIDMGKRPAPNLSIDRVNVNGNYEPENCRWANSKQQRANQRQREGARLFRYNGLEMNLGQWAKCFGITYNILYSKAVTRNLPLEDAIKKTNPKHYCFLKNKNKWKVVFAGRPRGTFHTELEAIERVGQLKREREIEFGKKMTVI